MPIQTIGKMSLKNQGGFVVRLAFSYFDENGYQKISNHTGDIDLGQTKTANPGDLGVPDGTTIWMYAFVVWGQNNGASQAFIYESGNAETADYVISGTTLNNSLALIGINESEWTNWAGSLSATPNLLFTPTSVSELQNIIQKYQGHTIRAAGTGHSWSPLVVTSDIIIDPTGITENGQKAWRWQKDSLNLVTYLPSARWSDVRDALTDPNNSLPQMYLPTAGVLPSINATGFVASGCHGTGWLQPTVSDLIYAIEIVDSNGTVQVFSEEATPDEMPIVRVSLGTLGIISKVTLKVELMYRLWDQEIISSTADVMGPNPEKHGSKIDPSKLSALITQNEYVELFWFPWSGGLIMDDGFIWVKQFNRTEDAPRDIPSQPADWQDFFSKILMEQVAQNPTSIIVPASGLLVWAQLKNTIEKVEQTNGFVADAPTVLHYQDYAFPVIDLEIAIPIPQTGPNAWDFTNVVRAWYQVVNDVRHKSLRKAYPVTTCLHARFIKNSQSLLSPAYEPASSNQHYCWIEILSAYPKTETNPDCREQDISAYQDLVNLIGPAWVNNMNGRPHWAKYWQTIPDINIKSLYPQDNLDQFNRLRRQLDPNGMFLNPFLKGLNLFE
jgi:hypothetical protein